MPYWAPLAAIPRSSRAPRFAEMNARPVTHAGKDRPESRKSRLEATDLRAIQPMPRTSAK
jgi:hypothetical protein